MSIRLATPQDYKSIVQIAKDSREPTNFTSISAIKNHLKTPPFDAGVILVAVGQNTLGYAEANVGQWSERGKYTRPPMVGTIRELVVSLSVRNRGIGTALLRACEEHLLKSGALVSFIEIGLENLRGRRFLEKRGYEVNSIWKWGGRQRQKLKKIISPIDLKG